MVAPSPRSFCRDGRNLNREIVRAGLAWRFERYAHHDTVLRDLEREARGARRGLWADPQAVPPWEWRKAGVSVRLRCNRSRGLPVLLICLSKLDY
jgi:endonuclease YncB( thermonuclease family)